MGEEDFDADEYERLREEVISVFIDPVTGIEEELIEATAATEEPETVETAQS